MVCGQKQGNVEGRHDEAERNQGKVVPPVHLDLRLGHVVTGICTLEGTSVLAEYHLCFLCSTGYNYKIHPHSTRSLQNKKLHATSKLPSLAVQDP
jgi:hypothetical protein